MDKTILNSFILLSFFFSLSSFAASPSLTHNPGSGGGFTNSSGAGGGGGGGATIPSGGLSSGGGGSPGGLIPWGSGCKNNHQLIFGLSRGVTCPIGWCEDNSTCGCSPCGGTPICAICSPSTNCPAGTSCNLPGNCQSLVCVGTTAISLPITKERFTASGLFHDGAQICEVNIGTTLENLKDKLKDEVCRSIYETLNKKSELYP